MFFPHQKPVLPFHSPPRQNATRPTGLRAILQQYWYLPALLLYMLLVVITAVHHEPWFDEGQAWLIARDLPPLALFTHILRYEGSPGLWHLLLLAPAKAHLPYGVINLISGVLAIAGIALFLARSPLPRVLTAVLPFTFFLAYQYAVVARSYVLLPLLLFAIALIYQRQREHPFLYTGLLCLLANASLHGLLIALTLIGISLVDWARGWKELPITKRRYALALLSCFAGVVILIVWQLWLPADLLSVTGHRDPLPQRTMKALAAVDEVMMGQPIFTGLLLGISLWWFRQTRVLVSYLAPTLVIFLFFALKYFNSWHEGILFLLWLFGLWLSFDAEARMTPDQRRAWPIAVPRNLLIIGVLALAGVQISWTCRTVQHDLAHNYSGSKAVADYLRLNHPEDATVCAYSFHANGILPYFDTNRFANFDNRHGSSFWFWSKRQRADRTLDEVLARKPDILILGIKFPALTKLPWEDTAFRYEISSEYAFAGYFDGKVFWKTTMKEYDAFAVYVRAQR